ncbi:hypothetical protein [Sporomusa sp.]|uniref:hypothetical protein n=1 Tax=Sporomusa sp. TaxID=2078658 RepID=UPI002CEAB9D0|nr:hypothetical protein [Sporomusa sp.]HWR06766.1 hypothetical protein [Sporomusa sp.]
MKKICYEQKLHDILYSNDWFMLVLRASRQCNPPGWFVGAGVIRNIVWDYLHNYTKPTVE